MRLEALYLSPPLADHGRVLPIHIYRRLGMNVLYKPGTGETTGHGRLSATSRTCDKTTGHGASPVLYDKLDGGERCRLVDDGPCDVHHSSGAVRHSHVGCNHVLLTSLLVLAAVAIVVAVAPLSGQDAEA